LWLAPELGLLDSRKEQNEVYGAAVQGLGGKLFLALFALPMAAQIPQRLVIRRLYIGWLLESLAFGVMVFGVTIFGFWLFRRDIRRRVRQGLNERGIHVCMACAYRLEGLTVPRCPECGRAFNPADPAESSDANVT
jgi:hypothetical protein